MTSCGTTLRVGVVGARRRRQGTGFHLARFCHAAGAEVVAVSGTTTPTVNAAVGALEQEGLTPRGHLDVESMLAESSLDVLVVASPHPAHEAALEAALAAGCHVLCEKPLVWGGRTPGRTAYRLATSFRDAGLHLGVNTQWPLTLPTFRALHPEAPARPPEAFWMRLSPGTAGLPMVPDALPHVLSMLLAVAPHPEPGLDDVRVEVLDASASAITVTFVWRAGRQRVRARVDLVQGAQQPRVAAYALDGRAAHRRIDLPDYRLHLESDGRRQPLPDPTPRVVQSFLARVSSGDVPVLDPNAWPATALLEELVAAWPTEAPAR